MTVYTTSLKAIIEFSLSIYTHASMAIYLFVTFCCCCCCCSCNIAATGWTVGNGESGGSSRRVAESHISASQRAKWGSLYLSIV